VQRSSLIKRYRKATWKRWLGAALVVWLLLAESFTVTHQYDSTAHANGQTCTVCVSAASFGASAVAVPFQFESAITVATAVIAVFVVVASVTPAHRYARGPPAVSF
jgi:hypothetical protein